MLDNLGPTRPSSMDVKNDTSPIYHMSRTITMRNLEPTK